MIHHVNQSQLPVRVLVADDEPTILSLMRSVLEDRGDCVLDLASNGVEALEKLKSLSPDLLITDLRMPRMSGEQLTSEALRIRPDLTILITTGNGTLDGAVKLMRQGVFDFITKPFLVEDFLGSVDRAVKRIHAVPMSKDSLAMISSLMTALETKDPYLKDHSSRVAKMCWQLGSDCGLGDRDVAIVERAGLVHDLGKIGVPDAILNKPGPLSPEEFEFIKKHPSYSVEIIRPLKELKDCMGAVYHHHERVDGTGYPDRVSGNDIPIGSRIISVCDAFDAMTSNRTYRKALSEHEAYSNLLAGRGTQFDRDILDMFLQKPRG